MGKKRRTNPGITRSKHKFSIGRSGNSSGSWSGVNAEWGYAGCFSCCSISFGIFFMIAGVIILVFFSVSDNVLKMPKKSFDNSFFGRDTDFENLERSHDEFGKEMNR